MSEESSTPEFNTDVLRHGGYVYSTSQQLSCRLSNQRMTETVLSLAQVEGRRVIDVGCGDGTYSSELARAGAREVLGTDAATEGIESARRRFSDQPNLAFEVMDVHSMELEERFDVAVVRGLLHHLSEVTQAIERIGSLADEIIVVEPNGYNPVLKIIEKLSPYHVRHDEKSYTRRKLDRWFRSCGGDIEHSVFINLVPMFCPELVARICKWIEPAVERTPVLASFACGQYVMKIRMK